MNRGTIGSSRRCRGARPLWYFRHSGLFKCTHARPGSGAKRETVIDSDPARLAQADIMASQDEQERSKCIFPSSILDTEALIGSDGYLATEAPLFIDKGLSIQSTTGLENAVCVAWALTLQCFVVADVFTFAWHSSSVHPGEDKGHQASRQGEGLCIVHIDQDDTVCDFARAFSSSESSAASKVLYSPKGGSRHQCNTAVSVRSEKSPPERDEDSTSPTLWADINLIVLNTNNSSTARVEYRAHHTSKDMASSVLEIFQHIFRQVLNASSHICVRNIDRCPREHREIIKATTNFETLSAEKCIHEMIIEQCERRPQSLAIVSPEGNLTYGQVNDLSAKLSLHIQNLGVKPETFVLCCFNKSAWAIIARLSILRAGGAYISVHADNPPSYLSSVLQQTKAQILLTDEASATYFKGLLPHMVVLGNELFSSLVRPAEETICTSVTPDNVCLVLFTSGSTGKPKGIIQTHRSYATGITNYAKALCLSDDTRYLQFDDYAFDISNVEFMTPLIVGGCCIVPNRMNSTRDLAFEINSKQANIVFMTPTVAIKLDPAEIPGLRNLCVGGEALSRDLIAKWKSSNTRLLCQYGMGEAAVCCALNTNLLASAGNVVGRPSTGSIWITDLLSIQKLMPVGSCGEIIIEGPHLARGYLDATNAKRKDSGFLETLPSWFTEMHPERASTARLYRSGDLGRLNFDGTVSYLGRKDTILKLDGCRIEAMEIEHLARKCLRPEETIIVDLLGVPDSRRDPALTAIVYFEDSVGSRERYSAHSSADVKFYNASSDPMMIPRINSIKRAVAQSLPPYMIPTLFLSMDAVPRTASKKIDRKKIRQFAQSWYMKALQEADSAMTNGSG